VDIDGGGENECADFVFGQGAIFPQSQQSHHLPEVALRQTPGKLPTPQVTRRFRCTGIFRKSSTDKSDRNGLWQFALACFHGMLQSGSRP
jgi:hypothetical protein